jgi:hypothetical protein
MSSQLESISLANLGNVVGGAGAGYNTGITGGLHIPNNRVPPPTQSGGYNTGITGGLNVPNNHVPPPHRPGNTGITGGLNVPNNRVPWSFFGIFRR